MNNLKNFYKKDFNELISSYMPWHFIPKIVSNNQKDYHTQFCNNRW